MNVERKGTGDAIRLRLRMSEKSTDELQQIISQRNPANTRQYVSDVKTRNAAAVALRVRGAMAAPKCRPANARQSARSLIESETKSMDARNWANEGSLQKIRDCGHPLAEAIADALSEYTVITELHSVARRILDGEPV